MDEIDKQILEILQLEGRITNAELSRRIGLAPATTLERVKKLENSSVITGYVAQVDPVKLNRGTQAFVSVTTRVHSAKQILQFQANILTLDEVQECHHIAGTSDYLLKVLARDIAHYEDFLIHKLTATPNIANIQTSFVLSTVKHETRIPVDFNDKL